MPNEAIQNAKDILTSVALLVGGGWGIWKWRYEEQLRRQKEIPSIDGTLEVTQQITVDDLHVLKVVMTWRNRGVLPIHVSTKETCIRLSRIERPLLMGLLTPFDKAAGIVGVYNVLDCDSYILEPNSETPITSHVVVPLGIFFVEWKLVYDRIHSQKVDTETSCSRSAIIEVLADTPTTTPVV